VRREGEKGGLKGVSPWGNHENCPTLRTPGKGRGAGLASGRGQEKIEGSVVVGGGKREKS